jgi:hypothetical protein
MRLIRQVNGDDLKKALDEVAMKCSAETMNLLRAICDAFNLVIEKVETLEAEPGPAPVGWYPGR